MAYGQSTPVVRPIDEVQLASRRGRDSCHACTYRSPPETLSPLRDMWAKSLRNSCPNSLDKALLVEAYEPEKADARLAIWDVPEAVVLHFPRQVWVHVDYRAYRRAYLQAFPNFDLTGLVLDHVMNRRVARLKGFAYLRVVPIARGAKFQPWLSQRRMGRSISQLARDAEKEPGLASSRAVRRFVRHRQDA